MKNESTIAELTFRAVVLGIVLSMILAAANAYLGLFAGMTVSASIPAAVVSMGLFRLLRKGSILENNIVQTAASAGESLAAGAIFTLPALLLLGFWKEMDWFQVAVLCGFGGLLGVFFTIPLRRSLIIQQQLQFPEGVATAEVLQTGQEGGRGLMMIIQSAVAGGLYKIAAAVGLWPETIEGAAAFGKLPFYAGANLSPALLSVGYIVGLNISILIFIGGLANWAVAVPLVSIFDHAQAGQPAMDTAKIIWEEKTRFIGVGAMVIGGLWTILQMRSSLLSGVVSGLKAYRQKQEDEQEMDRTERDIPMKWVLGLIVFSVVPLFIIYQVYVQQVHISLVMAVCMIITGFVFSAVAGYMAGLVGSSNNPISGVTIATVLTSALLLVLLMGKGNPAGPAAAIIIGAVVCCAAAIAGDNMQDLKAGYLVGATPWRQQIMQLVGTASAALVLGPVMMLLNNAYGFRGVEGVGPEALEAPQANLMASIAKGVFHGGLPWTYIAIGVAAGAANIIADQILKSRNSKFRMPVLAVAIGIYLPFKLSIPIFLGGVIHQIVSMMRNQSETSTDLLHRNGLLFSSGLITGEALMGILMAIPIVLLKPRGVTFPLFEMPAGGWIGTAVLFAIALWLLQTARSKD